MFEQLTIQEKQKLRNIKERYEKCIDKLTKRNEELEYQLITLDGLYVTDSKVSLEDFNKYNMWELDFKDVIDNE